MAALAGMPVAASNWMKLTLLTGIFINQVVGNLRDRSWSFLLWLPVLARVVDTEDSRTLSKWHCRAELGGRINNFMLGGISWLGELPRYIVKSKSGLSIDCLSRAIDSKQLHRGAR